MMSNHLKLKSFVAAFRHHYRARLPSMHFPYATPEIVAILGCLQQEHLIVSYRITKDRFSALSQFFHVTVYFSYINNNVLLFRAISVLSPRCSITNEQLQRWIRQKASLIFPVLILWLPTHGLLSDRQLVLAWLAGHIDHATGGHVLLRIDN